MNRRDFTRNSLGAIAALSLSQSTLAQDRMNQRIVLASRPSGKPTVKGKISDGQVLLQTRYLSLDPYMRGRMNAGESYAERVEIGQVMVGGTVSQVLESHWTREFRTPPGRWVYWACLD
jgi:NADPH-dependent curcumin reductase CurA